MKIFEFEKTRNFWFLQWKKNPPPKRDHCSLDPPSAKSCINCCISCSMNNVFLTLKQWRTQNLFQWTNWKRSEGVPATVWERQPWKLKEICSLTKKTWITLPNLQKGSYWKLAFICKISGRSSLLSDFSGSGEPPVAGEFSKIWKKFLKKLKKRNYFSLFIKKG